MAGFKQAQAAGPEINGKSTEINGKSTEINGKSPAEINGKSPAEINGKSTSMTKKRFRGKALKVAIATSDGKVNCGECGFRTPGSNLSQHYRQKSHRGREQGVLTEADPEPRNPCKQWLEEHPEAGYDELKPSVGQKR
jgi:hypothetical protein